MARVIDLDLELFRFRLVVDRQALFLLQLFAPRNISGDATCTLPIKKVRARPKTSSLRKPLPRMGSEISLDSAPESSTEIHSAHMEGEYCTIPGSRQHNLNDSPGPVSTSCRAAAPAACKDTTRRSMCARPAARSFEAGFLGNANSCAS